MTPLRFIGYSLLGVAALRALEALRVGVPVIPALLSWPEPLKKCGCDDKAAAAPRIAADTSGSAYPLLHAVASAPAGGGSGAACG